MKPLFHTSTGKAVADFITSPSHALLLSGPAGAGKGTVAAYIASTLLKSSPAKLHDHPYVLWLHDQDNVSIEDIRAAQKLMQLKVPGTQTYRRAVLVEQAHTMGHEAQNAFLKLLEEPPADTLIILTTASDTQLLPTILSRVQLVRVQALSHKVMTDYYQDQYDNKAIDRAFYLSEGYAGLAEALLAEDSTHPLVEQIQMAKEVLSSTKFERLAKIDEIVKQKNVSLFLQAMERVCHAALMQSVQKNSPAILDWKKRLQSVVDAQQLQKHNPSAKLLITDLFLCL